MNLEGLKKQELTLMEQLNFNREQQLKIAVEEFTKTYGIEIGDAIRFPDGNKFKTGVLDGFDYSGTVISKARVKLYNSDDTLGKRISFVWKSDFNRTVKIASHG